MVADAASRVGIRRIENCFHFLAGQVVDEALLSPLVGDSPDSADLLHRRGGFVLDVPHKGADGGQTNVARAHGIVALELEVIEEGKYDITIELLKGKSAWRFAYPLGNE